MRLFIALLLPEKIKEELAQNANDLSKYCSKGNFGRPENYHLTLKFLGETTEQQLPLLSQAIQEAAAGTTAFSLQLADWGTFPRGNQHIIWRALAKPYDELMLLFTKLETALYRAGWAKEQRPLKPHITLARQAVFTKPRGPIVIPQQALAFSAQQLALMESCRLDGQLTYIPLTVARLQNLQN
jgi:2'-5' RNA ligase